MQQCENPWLFLKPEGVHEQKKFGKHCLGGIKAMCAVNWKKSVRLILGMVSVTHGVYTFVHTAVDLPPVDI
jgi:hypothetical protein